jgi:hypothetical protein
MTDSNQLCMVQLGYGSFCSKRQPVAVAVTGVRVKKPDLTGPLNTMQSQNQPSFDGFGLMAELNDATLPPESQSQSLSSYPV